MKKKVTAPLSYDPGKGRPKEHLAYLNWQEMQELQRLNGGNMEFGPRGLPSFPPADAKGSSSKASSSSSRSSGGGGRDSGQAAARSSGSSKSSGSSYGGGGRDSGSKGGGGGAAPKSGGGGGGGGGGGARDSGAKGNVGMGKAPSAAKAPSYGGGGRDTGRAAPKPSSAARPAAAPSGVRSIPTVSRVPGVRTPSESQISGALSRASARTTQPRDEQGPISSKISPESYGWASTGPSRLAAHQAQRIYGRDLAMAGEKFSQKEFDTLLSSNTISDPSLKAQVESLSPEMRKNAAILSSAAKIYGVDPRIAIGMGAAESNLGTLKDRKNSQYQGLMQFGNAAWSEAADEKSKALGKKDPWASAQAGMNYIKQNTDRFVQRFGSEPTLRDVYGMHQQGAGGYMGLVGNPGRPAYQVVGLDAVMQNLPKSMRNQRTAKNITSEQFADIITKYPEKKLASLSKTPEQISGRTAVASGAGATNVVPTSAEAQPSGFSRMSPVAQLALQGAVAAGKVLGSPSDYKIPSIKEASAFTKNMVPDSVKIGYMQGEAERFGRKIPSYVASGVSSIGRGIAGAISDRGSVQQASSEAPSEYSDAQFQPYGMTYEQQQKYQETEDRKNKFMKGAAPVAGIASPVPLVGLGLNLANKAIDKAAEAKINKYVASSPAERAEQERKDPSLIGWARVIGVQPQNDYSVYQNWAEERGLRGPGESRGGQQGDQGDIRYAGGIGALPTATTPIDTSTTPAPTSGRRPYQYYQWDVGVNIPSPTDPNYTSYQEYLSKRTQPYQV